MKLVSIMAFNYEDLTDKAKHKARMWLDEVPFEFEDNEGNTYFEYPSEWEDALIAEHCLLNEYLFDKNGRYIHNLIEG